MLGVSLDVYTPMGYIVLKLSSNGVRVPSAFDKRISYLYRFANVFGNKSHFRSSY